MIDAFFAWLGLEPWLGSVLAAWGEMALALFAARRWSRARAPGRSRPGGSARDRSRASRAGASGPMLRGATRIDLHGSGRDSSKPGRCEGAAGRALPRRSAQGESRRQSMRASSNSR
jgi:hypothetical protein